MSENSKQSSCESVYTLKTKSKEYEEQINTLYARNPKALQEKKLEKKIDSIKEIRFSHLLIVELIMFVVGLVIEAVISVLNPNADVLILQLILLAIPIIIFLAVKLIVANVMKNKIKALGPELKSFHETVDQLIAANTECKNKILALERAEREQAEKRKFADMDAKYKNYVLVYVGEKSVCHYSDYKVMRNRIEIDGTDYGFVENKPFKAIYLNPGVHSIKVTVQSGNDLYTSNVQQFVVDNNCNYFVFESLWARGFKIDKFDNAADFFNFTGFYI